MDSEGSGLRESTKSPWSSSPYRGGVTKIRAGLSSRRKFACANSAHPVPGLQRRQGWHAPGKVGTRLSWAIRRCVTTT
jgi:hypothetical protein